MLLQMYLDTRLILVHLGEGEVVVSLSCIVPFYDNNKPPNLLSREQMVKELACGVGG